MREAIRMALDERAFCIVGTADREGWANVSYRGSVAVYSGDTLSFWNRNRTLTVTNIEENPKVTIFYRNRQREANWRFFGHARIATDPDERQRVIEVTDDRELAADPDLKGIGVLVKVERVIDQAGRVVLQA
jgi:predicted pyridoxine 5'-phosphate oxidase superfamily flavin-nucleotide-binding protein